MAKQLREGRQQALWALAAHSSCPGPREQPSMEEQRRGHKLKKELWPRVERRGRDNEWKGWSGSERGKEGVERRRTEGT